MSLTGRQLLHVSLEHITSGINLLKDDARPLDSPRDSLMNTDFLARKTQQALLYIASDIIEQRNMYKVLKVIYFADIAHMFNYGRFITGDDYVALHHGPVPSFAYDIVKDVKLGRKTFRVDEKPFFSVKNDTVVPLIEADISCFSRSDLECLDKAIEVCRPLDFTQLKNKSHDAAYEAAGENDIMSIESIVSMAPNNEGEILLDYIKTNNKWL